MNDQVRARVLPVVATLFAAPVLLFGARAIGPAVPVEAVVFAVLTHVSAFGIGSLLLSRAPHAVALRWPLGLGVVGIFNFSAAALGLLSPWVIVAVFGLGLVVASLKLLDAARAGHALKAPGPWMGLTFAWIAFIVLRAAAPPMFYDALMYHLAHAQQVMITGHLISDPLVTFAGMPLVAELSLSPALLLGGTTGMSLAHASVLLCLAHVVFDLARRRIAPRAAGVATVLVVSAPVIAFEASALKSDLLLAVFTAALISTWFGRELKLAAVFAGLCLATKLTAVIFVPVVLVAILVNRKDRAALKSAIPFVVVGVVLGALPWIKNAIYFDNPIYPVLNEVFGGPEFGPHIDALNRRMAAHDSFRSLDRLRDLFTLPVDLSVHATQTTMNNLAGVAFLALWPLLVLVRPLPLALRRLHVVVLVPTPLWLFTLAYLRLFPALVITGALGVAFVFERTTGRTRQVLAAIACAALALSASWTLSADAILLHRPLDVVRGLTPAEDALDSALPEAKAFRFLNRSAPPGARVLVVSDGRIAHLERPALWSDPYAPPIAFSFMVDAQSADDIRLRFRAAGIGAVVVNHSWLPLSHRRWLWPDLASDPRWSMFLDAAGERIFEDGDVVVYRPR